VTPSPIRVLVVDDTDHVRDMLCTMLEIDGFDVVGRAGDGDAALQAASSTDPDVVVVDYMMPGVDGLETARRIREQRQAQTIILYSAFVEPAVADAAAAAGIALCLGKVDGLGLLEDEIRRLAG
jgi:response regulator NasT